MRHAPSKIPTPPDSTAHATRKSSPFPLSPFPGIAFPFLALLALLSAAPLRAQDVTFEARADRSALTMNDTLTLQLVISGGNISATQPTLPPIPGFRAYSSGQSQNYSFVNGRVSSQVVYSYALAPQAPGDYTIPPFTIRVGGKPLSTDPIQVKVVSGAAPAPAAPSAPAGATRPGPAARKADMFVTTSVDKETAHVGEAVTLTFRFYTRARLTSQPSYSPPDVTGFLAEDLPPQRQYTETVQGVPYSVIELKTALFPVAPGRHVIGPAALECAVQDFSADPFQNFFEDFFAGGKPVTLRSDPLTVDVLPLPDAGRPDGFKGDVGRFTVTASLDKTSAQVHEPLTLTVTVSGEGNVKSVAAPALPPLSGFKTYETLSSLNVSKTDYRMQGSKVFKTILKPDVSGMLEVPPVAFSFFDPRAKRYQTVRTAPQRLAVSGSSAPETADAAAPAVESEGLKVVSQDIRFIKSKTVLAPVRPPLHDTRAFLLLNVLPLAGFLGAWGLRFRRDRHAADPLGRASRRAYGKAEKSRRRAEAYLSKEDFTRYYEALHRAYLDYLGEKMGEPPQGLTWDRVEEALRRLDLSDDARRAARAAWENFDLVRYTPSLLNRAEAEKHGAELAAVLKTLESGWKA